MSLLDVNDAVSAAVDARTPAPKTATPRKKSTLIIKPDARQEEWGDFKKGEMVRVRDESGAKFRFVAYVPEGVNGASKAFVEVFGGRRGKEKMRYINPERIIKIKPKRTRTRTVATS